MDSTTQQRPASEESSARQHNSSARSCITCAKAKAKCVRQPGQQICERCTRLHKECQLKEPVQRKRKPAKLTRTAQLENLENKLHNLVHALSAQQAQKTRQEPQQTSNHGHPSPSTSNDVSEREGCLVDPLHPINCNQPSNQVTPSCHESSQSTAPSVFTPAPSYQSTQTMTSDSLLSMSDATILFDRYIRLMAPTMPFVVIPEGTDAWEIAQQKPFLMQVITTVAFFHDLPRQQVMVKDLMRQISEKLLMRNEKSLEVLQGIMILIAWYHPHIMWAQQSVLLLHLAMSLTADLNIDRSPDSCEKFRLAHHGTGKIPALPPFTNDERRAFLGTYYLTSMMSTSFKKLSALKWSPWMTECAATLEKDAEFQSDAFLIAMVRTQHIMEDVMNIDTFDAPVRFLANSFQADLDSVAMPVLSGRPKVLLQQQKASVHIAIWTHALTGLSENKSKQQSSELRQRLDAMWRCVESVRTYFEYYLSIPPQDFLILPFQVFGQSVQASVTLLRLATLEHDGWDLAALREELSYSAIIGEISRKFESVETLPVEGIAIRNDAFTKWAAKTRWMKSLYDSRYPPDNETSPAAPIDVSEGGRRWPDGVPQQNPQTNNLQTAATVPGTAPANAAPLGGMVNPAPQYPTPDDWTASMTNPQTVFTYFDDVFWNNVNFDNFDFGAMPDVQMS